MSDITLEKDIEIEGMGIVFHSGGILKTHFNGYDFLNEEFWNPKDVAKHVKKGDITALCTGSPGLYHLKFKKGYPTTEELRPYAAAARIGIIIDTGKLYIRDLYDLEEWDCDCNNAINITLENGIYIVTAVEDRISDEEFYQFGQDIQLFLERVETMPTLNWDGVPMLVYE